jgi:hypothetical protein
VSGSIRNSVVGSSLKDDSIEVGDCDPLDVSYSVIEDQVIDGDGNIDWTWDDNDFSDPGGGDFSTVMGSAFENVALWVDGDPSKDWNGDDRPAGMNDMDYAGADVP